MFVANPVLCAAFVAGLAENRCLSKRPSGATLLQIGEQDVAFGAKFRARVVLDIQEHAEGTVFCRLHTHGAVCTVKHSQRPTCNFTACTISVSPLKSSESYNWAGSRACAYLAAGTPQNLCSGSRTDEQLYPLPRGPSSGCPSKDVCFSMIEGDFQVTVCCACQERLPSVAAGVDVIKDWQSSEL